ncbi:MAG: DUF4351 domain-containing protein [Methylothermaceae bacterium]|nr:DUF4351 domain-containing protein [Methylothermaceae bacterium]
MSHDQNFKNLILDYPRQALAFFAAEEASGIDEATRIVPIRQEQLKKRLGDRFRELDVSLLVEWPDGRREALLFVVEEESDPRRFSIHRLGHYCLDLAELFETERVVPVVIFLRGGTVRRELTLGGDRHTFLNFRYLACDLADIPYELHRDSGNIVARLNLPNMRYDPQRRVEVFAHAVRGLTLLEPDPEKQIKYLEFIDIYTGLDDNERARYVQEYPKEAEIMSTFAERFIEQGIQQGMQKGMQQGEARILIRLLQRKFGDLPENIRQRIEAADVDTLLAWSDRVLTARNLEEVVRS